MSRGRAGRSAALLIAAFAVALAAGAAKSPRREVAVLAGGCFWGMEDVLRRLPGVLDTEVGYTGGRTADPTPAQVASGTTGHAEAIRVGFDPDVLSYEELLLTFFRMHDPTTRDRQGNDVGAQYRSAIFCSGREQCETARRVRDRVEASGRWKRPLTTEIARAARFWPAGEAHQDYLEKNPGGYSCHYLRDFDFEEPAGR